MDGLRLTERERSSFPRADFTAEGEGEACEGHGGHVFVLECEFA